MTLADELDALQARGVLLSVEGRKLRFRGPAGSLTDADRVWLRERRDEILRLLRERAASRSERLPLSAGQQSMWMVDRLSPGGAINNLASAVRFGTPADLQASQDTLQVLLDRHSMLRTSFHLDERGELFQQIAGASVAAVEIRDASGLAEAELRSLVEEERNRPFDLERGPPVRLTLFRLGEAEHLQLLVAHHVVSDGGSIIMLMFELISMWSALRGGTPVELPALRSTYADYVRSQADLLAGPKGEALWTYWRDELSDAPCHVPFAFDREQKVTSRSGSVTFTLGEDLVARLVQLGGETTVTSFTLFLTLFELFLARFTGTSDIVIGSSFADRPADCVGVVGDFVNALPVRARLRWGMTIREALAQQRGVVHNAIEACAYPVQRLIERLHPERSTSASPLFNCYFNFGSLPAIREFAELLGGHGEGLTFDGVKLMPFAVTQQQHPFDLTLSLGQSETTVVGRFDFSADLFDGSSIEHLAAEFVAFLERCAADPDDTLLGREESRRLLDTFNETARPFAERPFIEQLLERARDYPERVAVRFGDETLSYAQLLEASNRLAQRLRAAGVRRGHIVGIAMERSPAMLAALLAVQQTGAAYLPLDPAYPPERLAFMAADSGLTLFVADGGRPAWIADEITVISPEADDHVAGSAEAMFEGPAPDDLAYILYTSGSTGKPNGVRISHRALSNFLGSMLVEPGIGQDDVFAAITTISFDIAALELFGPLLVGATIDLLPCETARDGAAIAERCAQAGATILQATPTQWREIIGAEWRPSPGFRALSGGEALPGNLAAALLQRDVTLWNLYGPTETTIHSMASRIDDATDIHVGRPIANTRIYVLDPQGEPVPIGIAGDIWIGGAGLAQGYHERPELTAERFRSDPFSGLPSARMYRTGDLGRWREDGTLVHLGRGDDQIKLRGFRIELSEIEACLTARDDVQGAVVVPRASGDDIRLVAFLVHAPGQAPGPQELRRNLRQLLPEYMVPAMFVEIAALPVTPNGKIDRRSLPNPFEGAAVANVTAALEGELEHRLAEIWQQVLGIERVGPRDNFFDLGGHSLLALKVATALRRRTGLQLAPELLFFHSLRDIAAALQGAEAARAEPGLLRWTLRGRRRSVAV